MDNHFMRGKTEQIPLSEIVEDCIGEKGIYLRKYYNDIKFLMKKFFIQEVKKVFESPVCDDDIFACMIFFRQINLFTEMDFDVLESTKAN